MEIINPAPQIQADSNTKTFVANFILTIQQNLRHLWCGINSISKILALPLVGLVWVYQKTLSPDHGLTRGLHPFGYCKFYPTCSEYSRLTLIQQGILGLPKIIKRVISCRPSTTPQIHLP